jgi:soluble lytic murein transglycosylase-like protein
MRKIKTLLLSFAFAVVAMGSSDLAWAADWSKTRSLVMTLREQRDFTRAYQVASTQSGSTSDMFDAQFLSGWIALRNLNNPSLAIAHFSRMAALAPAQREHIKNASKAQAGYWLGRALVVAGRGSDASVLYQAASRYPNTFYGQLAASEIKVGLTKGMISAYSEKYPDKSFYWLDQRTKKEFVLAVIREESSFKQQVVSNKGARGLMQVMPGTAKHIGKNAGVNVDLGMMASNEHYNVAVGSKYLADQMDRYRGNPMLAAAAYNAGPGRVDEWLQRFGDPRGSGVDPIDWVETIPFTETRDYVKKVIGSYITYMALAYNK